MSTWKGPSRARALLPWRGGRGGQRAGRSVSSVRFRAQFRSLPEVGRVQGLQRPGLDGPGQVGRALVADPEGVAGGEDAAGAVAADQGVHRPVGDVGPRSAGHPGDLHTGAHARFLLPLAHTSCHDGIPAEARAEAKVSVFLTDAPGEVSRVWVRVDDIVLVGDDEIVSVLDELLADLIELTSLADETIPWFTRRRWIR